MRSVFGMLPLSILPVQASPINGLFSCVVAGSELHAAEPTVHAGAIGSYSSCGHNDVAALPVNMLVCIV